LPELTAGEVELRLGDVTHVLRPTLRAALDLSRRFEGFHHAEVLLVSREIDAYVAVIMAGLGLPADKRMEIERSVYEAGLIAPPRDHNPELLDPLVAFLSILQNGGRPIEPQEGEDPGEAKGA